MEAPRAHDRIALKVAEAPQSDVGMGRARVDMKTRTRLGAGETEAQGEAVIEIIGEKSTAAKLFRLAREDEGKGIIRIDGIVRRNAGMDIGDEVEVRKAVVSPAVRVTIGPMMAKGHKISFGQGIENFVKRGLLKRPLTKGDVVIVPGIALMGGALPFMVIQTEPWGSVIVSSDTAFALTEESVREEPTLGRGAPPEDVYAKFTSGLQAVLMEHWASLDHLEGPAGVRARTLRDELYRKLKEATFEDDTPEKG